MKVEAKCFEADLCSFQELINVESAPQPLHEALERLRPVSQGPNFVWEKVDGYGDRYGGALSISYEHILWYPDSQRPDMRTHTEMKVSFLHRPGVAHIFQPVLPVVSLLIAPRSTFRPMFDMDPRSFHTFKLAWRRYLDFGGASDYRLIVGDQLERWTTRCKAVIERPLNATYWLMLMVGSYYHEVLVRRRVIKPLEQPPERVPVICIDSFVALSSIIFAAERQVLFAGTDPTPSYLQWLQYIGDQHSFRKVRKQRRKSGTVFEMNEFLDLAVVVVFYGRIQQKVKESSPLSWVGNPALLKGYIAKYMDDNRCSAQFEHAVRLYTYSCAVGRHQRPNDQDGLGGDTWHCWNGLSVCEIGVPMPCTQATLLSPFVTTRPVSLLCSIHGPDAVRRSKEMAANREKEGEKDHGKGLPKGSRPGSPVAHRESPGPGGSRMDRSNSRTSEQTGATGRVSSLPEIDTEVDSDTETESQSEASSAQTGRFQVGGKEDDRPAGADDGARDRESRVCMCARYLPGIAEVQKLLRGTRRRRKLLQGTAFALGATVAGGCDPQEVMSALGDFDVLHSFAAVLAGGLNLAKHFLRVHFSVDPAAYERLPAAQGASWQDGLLPWYREFHRADAHGRSRYGVMLERLVRGLLGDGFTSGLPVEVLDMLRVSQDAKDEVETIGRAASDQQSEELGIGKKRIDGQGQQGATTQPNDPATRKSGLKLRRGSEMRLPGGFGALALGQAVGRVPEEPGTRSLPNGLQDTLTAAMRSEVGSPTSRLPPGSKLAKGIVSDLALWTELYECESIYNYRSHFENFTHWCHSAHMVPFLQRCYRRCGVAGLVPGARTGGQKPGADPAHPLVLPTMAGFPYGHCYPLHRVLQYFYGGVDSLVCSVGDPQAQETERAALGLISGQERLNSQCWFQPNLPDWSLHSEPPSAGHSHRPSQVWPTTALTDRLLEQLQDYIQDGAGKQRPRSPSANPGSPRSQRGSLARISVATRRRLSRGVEISLSTFADAARERDSAPPYPLSPTSRAGSVSLKVSRRATVKAAAPLQHRGKVKGLSGHRHKLGALVPDDPFFWFCQGNFAAHTYPASAAPRQFFNDVAHLTSRYTDFVSRSGTPERKGDTGGTAFTEWGDKGVHRIPDQPLPPPPSICVCQPTELSDKPRERWEVEKEFVDSAQLILGDGGWWPGALGQRFVFEAKTENVDWYVRLSVVPQVYLLYIEHTALPSRAEAQARRAAAAAAAEGGGARASPHPPGGPGSRQAQRRTSKPGPWYESDDDDSEAGEEGEHQPPSPRTELRRKRRKQQALTLVVPLTARRPSTSPAGLGAASQLGGGGAAGLGGGGARGGRPDAGAPQRDGVDLMLPPLLPPRNVDD